MGCTDVSDLKTCSETDVTEKSNFPIRRKDGIRLIDVDGWSRLAIVLCKCCASAVLVRRIILKCVIVYGSPTCGQSCQRGLLGVRRLGQTTPRIEKKRLVELLGHDNGELETRILSCIE